MVCVDTNILITCYRNPRDPANFNLDRLAENNQLAMCGPVWVEFIGGFRDAKLRKLYADLWRNYPYLETPRRAYELAADWVAMHPKAVEFGDALIAATAVVNSASLLTLDRDFDVLCQYGLEIAEPMKLDGTL